MRGVDGRQPICPRLCRFELCGQAEERGLIAKPAQEVRPDWEVGVVPPQRNGHRGIAGEVGNHACVAYGLPADIERPPWIIRG